MITLQLRNSTSNILYDSQQLKDDKNTYFHTRTNKHIRLVKKYAKKIESSFPEMAGLVAQAEHHDASKFSEPELTPYIELTCNKRTGNKQLPKNIQRDIDSATLLHITTNRHHPEFHSSYIHDERLDTPINAEKMPDIDISEMCADWLAMSEELGTSINEWCDNVISKRWSFNDKQTQLIKKIIGMFGEKQQRIRIIFEDIQPSDIYDITYLTHIIGHPIDGHTYAPFAVDFLKSRVKKYLDTFRPLIFNQLKKYQNRGRIDPTFFLPKFSNTLHFSTMLEAMKKTYRSDMTRRNIVWENLVKYLNELEEMNITSQMIGTILFLFDRIHNCVHNTNTSIFDKFVNGRELLSALDFCFSSTPNELKQRISSEVKDLIFG